MRYLLDVNVLIALFDPDHTHHEASHRWWESVGKMPWATCPITENGFARILGNPNYPDSPGSPDAALIRLMEFTAATDHVFWPDSISLLDKTLFNNDTAYFSRQVTDIYLLALARSNGGKLATFDRRINAAAVQGGVEALHIIAI
ncbi:TA system VapC family ribonuclease toxin [Pararhizobium arenae]|uniref:TA system VapC family ribonuclease toxin n=1 Tax=Pararhizobium arenae TaxID=1856850 RepID=UPI00094B42DD|nr:TA system VapC family ribonuclease toxin [Pararhizobium arenae]